MAARSSHFWLPKIGHPWRRAAEPLRSCFLGSLKRGQNQKWLHNCCRSSRCCTTKQLLATEAMSPSKTLDGTYDIVIVIIMSSPDPSPPNRSEKHRN